MAMDYRHVSLQDMLTLLSEKEKQEINKYDMPEARKMAIYLLKKYGYKTATSAIKAIEVQRNVIKNL